MRFHESPAPSLQGAIRENLSEFQIHPYLSQPAADYMDTRARNGFATFLDPGFNR